MMKPHLAQRTRQLLDAAAKLAEVAPSALHGTKPHPALAEFTRIYREWIIRRRGMNGAVELRSEQWRLMLYCMASAATLGEAVQLLLRFKKLVWDQRVAIELRDEGRDVALVFNEPLEPDAEGLMSALWPLSVHMTQFEFLIGGPLQGATARVRNAKCLPDRMLTLLFDRPLTYDAAEVALVFPKRQLQRAIVVRAADIPAFAGHVMPALVHATSRRPDQDLPALVAGLIRNDRLRSSRSASDLSDIAARLGCGPATLRRNLHAGGTSFRQIKDRVFVTLAKDWLTESDLRIEQIAERLGYSDAFAFRRWFRRMNGVSPQTFRTSAAHRL